MTGWLCRGKTLPVFEKVHIMGILNVTPDSFSDGGEYLDPGAAFKRALQMCEEGADIIDVGGESTRPGALAVDSKEQIRRVVPAIKALAAEVDVAISVDTTSSRVAEAAIEAGAHIVNDVSALRFDPAMAGLVARSTAGVVLMHMLGEPGTMQENPLYGDVVGEVRDSLLAWAAKAEEGGIEKGRIAIDPGLGFGKTRAHNLLLLKAVGFLANDRYPLLVGPSRKSFIGAVLDTAVDARIEGTAAAVAWAVAHGANIVRVHDVREMAQVVRMIEAIENAE